MPRVLVIHGAGMNMRGKVQVEIFGPMTLPEYDERIRGYAKELGVEQDSALPGMRWRCAASATWRRKSNTGGSHG